MQQHRFKDFWLEAEHVEWKGLWERGCFEKWKPSDLEPNDRVFGSRYHYKIKHNAVTGLITKFKVRLVVQGHKMQKGEDYEESFAPVPHSTISRVMMALSEGNNYHLRSIDLTQAFIQADSQPRRGSQRSRVCYPSSWLRGGRAGGRVRVLASAVQDPVVGQGPL